MGRDVPIARLLGLALFAAPAALAAFAPWLFPGDPLAPMGRPFASPGPDHLLGTDDLGRDLLAALAHGGRRSLLLAAGVALAAGALGLTLGVVAGQWGGWRDRLILRLTDASQVVPRFFLALVILALLGHGVVTLWVVLSLTSWAAIARQTRIEAQSLRGAGFVEAALLMGRSRWRVALSHVVPHAIPIAAPHLPLVFASCLVTEAALAFVGIGDPNTASWGALLQTAHLHALRGWWLAVFPALALALACVGLALMSIGDPPRRARVE